MVIPCSLPVWAIDRNKKCWNNQWKFRLIFTTLLAIPLFVISMADLMPFYINIPFKISIYLQLILSTLIIIIGIDFYRFGFSKLIKLNPDMNSLIALSTSSAYVFSIITILNQMVCITTT